jgi:enediyne biosynthesis protein E4
MTLLSCVVLPGCSEDDGAPRTSRSTARSQQVAETDVNSPIVNARRARSLGSFHFIDQDGEAFDESDIDGKAAVINFIFTTCPGTCPRQTQAMLRLQDRLRKADANQSVQLITITVDPETDTPSVLRRYADGQAADTGGWSFLTGEREQIWSFSKDSLGMAVSLNPDDPLIPIAHESKFVLIDRAGRIRSYFDALEQTGFEELWNAIDIILPEFEPDSQVADRHGFHDNVRHMAQPPGILDGEWLEEAAQREADALADAGRKIDFQFEECREETGIQFHPQIVDDQRHRLLVNHYDHGNSVSVADVDNDGNLDIYFVSQVGPNELWRSDGDGRFENITDQAGVGLADRISVAASFCDVDNDGDADLYVTSIRGQNALLTNDGNGQFTDTTAASGLAYNGHSSKGVFFDYDKDGLPDLYLCNVGRFTTEYSEVVRHDLGNSHPEVTVSYFVGRGDAFSGHLAPELSEPSILYHNLGGGRFEDVTAKVGMEEDTSWNGDAVVFDANGDAWPDLYVGNMQGHDHLYINQAGERFTDETDAYFSATPWGTMGVAVFDFDNNGLLDLFLTDMHSDMSHDIGPDLEKRKSEMTWPEEFLQSKGRSIYGNAFYLQTEVGNFTEVSDEINAENYWPWGLSYGDFDADGWPDAFVCSSMCFPYRYGVNSLLINQQGQRFVDAQFTTGIEPRRDDQMIAPWFSLDFSEADATSQLRQGREGEYVVWSAPGTRSCVLFDFDNDGDLDIITNEFNTPPQVFRSSMSDNSKLHYLKIRLQGTLSGRNAYGALVTVRAGDDTWTQLHNGTSGYLSQSLLPLYFGLGTAVSVDEVKVTWPSGKTTTLEDAIEANQTLHIKEPAQ